MPPISSVAAMRMATPIAVSQMTIGRVVWPVAMSADRRDEWQDER